MIPFQTTPPQADDATNDCVTLRPAAHEVTADEDLVDILLAKVVYDRFESGNVAVDVGDDGYGHLGIMGEESRKGNSYTPAFLTASCS